MNRTLTFLTAGLAALALAACQPAQPDVPVDPNAAAPALQPDGFDAGDALVGAAVASMLMDNGRPVIVNNGPGYSSHGYRPAPARTVKKTTTTTRRSPSGAVTTRRTTVRSSGYSSRSSYRSSYRSSSYGRRR